MEQALDARVALRLKAEAEAAGLDLLVLFGSRVRGEARPDSDWDFGFLAKKNIDQDALREVLVQVVGAEHVDLVALDRANGLLCYSVAAEGVLIFERIAGVFMDFREAAVQFWCEAEPVLSRAYEEVLAKLRAA